MTDLERARALIRAWASDEHRELRLIGKSQEHLPSLMEGVADALAAARREGEEKMRERTTPALDAAVRAACPYERWNEEHPERICRCAFCSLLGHSALAAALPVEPPTELRNLMIANQCMNWRQSYELLRAHLLGEEEPA